MKNSSHGGRGEGPSASRGRRRFFPALKPRGRNLPQGIAAVKLCAWSIAWLLVSGVFVLLGSALVGLSVYAVIMFGQWWPQFFGIRRYGAAVLGVLTMLPFLLLFSRINWSPPWNWMAGHFVKVLAPIDARIVALRAAL